MNRFLIFSSAAGLLTGAVASAAAQAASPDLPGRALVSTVPSLPIPLSVVAAEREGATFPAPSVSDSVRARMLSRYSGSPDRTCHDASTAQESALRSGDFVIGGGIHRLIAGRGTKVWWFPIGNPTQLRSGLLLRAARLDSDRTPGPSDTLRVMNLNYGYPVGTFPPQAFYPGGLNLPLPGRWLVVGTAGDNWGCVILTVASSPAR